MSKKLQLSPNRARRARKSCSAVGSAEASQYFSAVHEAAELASSFHADEVAYVSLGDGATSEGEFWEALNWSANRKLPVLYVVEDNGYAISVPVDVQTAGGSISRLVKDFPHLLTLECDGTDFRGKLRGGGEGRRTCAQAERPGADPCARHAALLALALG